MAPAMHKTNYTEDFSIYHFSPLLSDVSPGSQG